MGAALNTASAANAYVLADRGTWLSFKNRGDLDIVVEGDNKLFNQYGVILVNPEKHPNVKKAEGQAFIDWIVSPEGQKAIADYKINGNQLFFPNATANGGVAVFTTLASRMRRSVQRCAADPGPIVRVGPGSAAHHFALLVLRCARDTSLAFAASLLYALLMPITPTHASDIVLLHAAGSLRGALTEVSAAYEKSAGVTVQAKYGPSGLLRDEIAGGAKAEVFASANMDHPMALAKAGKAGAVALFARNQLCALVKPGLAVTPDNAARAHARSGDQARHLDAEGRSVRRLCVRSVSRRRMRSRRARTTRCRRKRCN